MCLVKKPKIPKDQGKDKPLPVLRNPILDGMLGNIAALRAGTSAFRIDLINPLKIPGAARPFGSSSSKSGSSGSGGGSTSSSGGGSTGGGSTGGGSTGGGSTGGGSAT